MEFIALPVFIITQIAIIPLVIIGGIIATYRQVFVSKKLGVSSTAISVISARWLMDVFDLRKNSISMGHYFEPMVFYHPSFEKRAKTESARKKSAGILRARPFLEKH